MKKLVLAIAVATMLVSCQKVTEGGNVGTLKLEEGTARYTDDQQSTADHSAASAHKDTKSDSVVAKPADSAKVVH